MTGGQAVPRPVTGALGIEARSSHTLEGGGGGVRGVHRPKGGDRRARFKLLDVVRRLSYRRGMPRELQNRVCTCHYSRRGGQKVKVRRDVIRGRCHFGGLESCRNVWICPVCNGLITEERRAQLQRAVGRWKDQGGEVYLLTLTFPHARADRLKDVLALMRNTINDFNRCRAVVAARAAAGYVGQIRALEVTWGSWHGWHPHFHILLFCAPGQLEVLKRMESAWVDALIKSGLADKSKRNDMLHGAGGSSPAFDIQNGDFAADYVAKFGHEPTFRSKLEAAALWGVAREMVKGMSKTGRRLRGLTPFTILAVIAGVILMHGMKRGQAVALFSEYSLAFKNQRQLYWSRGLEKRLNLGQLFTDDELPDALDRKPDIVDVCELEHEDWRLVVAHQARDDVLIAAEEDGERGVRLLLERLRARPPTAPAGVEVREPLDEPRIPWPRPGFAVVENSDGSTRHVFERVRR